MRRLIWFSVLAGSRAEGRFGGPHRGDEKAQVMVDSVFIFSELGFQEFEMSKYLFGILKKEGFKVERGVACIPTAFLAIDDIPQASENPGVAYHEPMIEGARARRRPQLRHAPQHPCRTGG
jgi:hypothetical protein